VLCWAALQRLIELHEKGQLPRAPVRQFIEVRDKLKLQIENEGYSHKLQSYTQTLGGDRVDASLLLLPWYGYCAADSPRMLATWRRIQEDLSMGDGLFKRYEGKFTEGEGAFGICSFWAAEYVALGGGSLEEATARFEDLLGYSNDVGLYAEEIDPRDGSALGNFPQAYTHVGLINAAISLRARAEKGADQHLTSAPEAHP
jgi:GH15 family glucan-1,4-alpha-glucosidase